MELKLIFKRVIERAEGVRKICGFFRRNDKFLGLKLLNLNENILLQYRRHRRKKWEFWAKNQFFRSRKLNYFQEFEGVQSDKFNLNCNKFF